MAELLLLGICLLFFGRDLQEALMAMHRQWVFHLFECGLTAISGGVFSEVLSTRFGNREFLIRLPLWSGSLDTDRVSVQRFMSS